MTNLRILFVLMELNFEKFDRVISAFRDSLSVYENFSSKKDVSKALMNTIKAGVIQNFEVAYDQ